MNQEEIIKWDRNDIVSILTKSGGSAKQKSSYYSGLNGRNPDGAFTHVKPGGLFDTTYTYFFFGMTFMVLCRMKPI